MKPTNETGVTDSPEDIAGGSPRQHGSAAREYWLYAWPEHHYLKGRPSEYSKPPIKIMASDIKEATQRAHDAAPEAIKWELYHGSGWAGNAPLATYTKPPNDYLNQQAKMTGGAASGSSPSNLLEANSQEHKCDEWTYEYDGEWTYIDDEDGNRVTTFYRRLLHAEVSAFKEGWGVGWDKGIRAGRAQKAIEIRQALGL